jgi:CDP-6-deoxy-D-xylo-4-hexulose-3-dehydrase
MGEGGAVSIVHRPPLKTYAESFRDWGRDCWCASGKDNTCNKRFDWQLGELPRGYDHKYIYSHLGYNLKPLDPQAAIGRQQLKKLPAFVDARKQNWETLRAGLAGLEEFFDFSLPTHATAWVPPAGLKGETVESLKSSESGNPSNLQSRHSLGDGGSTASHFQWDDSGCRTDCSWFGFMLRVKPTAPFSHTDLARHLDGKKIGNRMFFGGNLLRQPVFVQLKKDRPESFRVAGDLAGADEIMHRALFLGTYPGLTGAMLDYEINVIRDFVKAGR